MNYFLFSIVCFITSWMAFTGLIGSVKKNMKYPMSRGGGVKKYKGRSARIWGALFFLFFGWWSGMWFMIAIQDNTNLMVSVSTYFTSTFIGLLASFYSRKQGRLAVDDK